MKTIPQDRSSELVQLMMKHQRKLFAYILTLVPSRADAEDILEAYENGISDFGENYLQESLEKISKLKDLEISWHFIGNIQIGRAHV